LGGIGAANVGSRDWEEKMYLLKKRKEYGNQNQIVNNLIRKPP
jgi:hypothetical protein